MVINIVTKNNAYRQNQHIVMLPIDFVTEAGTSRCRSSSKFRQSGEDNYFNRRIVVVNYIICFCKNPLHIFQ